MLCDDCKQNEAVFHSKIIKNGVSKEKHLCAACQQKYGFNSGFMGGFNEGFDDLFSSFTHMMLGNENPKSIICQQCGTTSDEFLESGYVGCSNCYKAFESVMMPVIRNMQNDVKHIGKSPDGEKKTANQEIEQLQLQLRKAIETEEFEEASILRDKINELKKAGK